MKDKQSEMYLNDAVYLNDTVNDTVNDILNIHQY